MSEIIYHYTTAAGLLGMLRDRGIWCSHLAFLNDKQEYRFIADEYRQLLVEMSRDTELSRMQRLFASAGVQRLDENFFADVHGHGRPEPLRLGSRGFVASFSEHFDDLSQWRAYGGSGLKFCLGFRRDRLEGMYSKFGFKLVKVKYGVQDIADELREKFLRFAEIASTFQVAGKDVEDPIFIHPPEFYHFNRTLLEEHAPIRKNKAFEAEAEWRLLGSYAPDVSGSVQLPIKVREGKDFLIPYVLLPLFDGPRPLISITAGPTSSPQETLAAMEYLNVPQGGPDDPGVEMGVSAIPFRA